MYINKKNKKKQQQQKNDQCWFVTYNGNAYLLLINLSESTYTSFLTQWHLILQSDDFWIAWKVRLWSDLSPYSQYSTSVEPCLEREAWCSSPPCCNNFTLTLIQFLRWYLWDFIFLGSHFSGWLSSAAYIQPIILYRGNNFFSVVKEYKSHAVHAHDYNDKNMHGHNLYVIQSTHLTTSWK